MIKNVAVYCRVSTEEQRKFGISVNDQKDSLTKYCKKNNYKIYDYYIDEGVSAGTISKRKEFVRLLKDLDNIDLIIFTKLDRFSRNVRDANNLLVELDAHNCSFKAIDEDDIDTSTADGRFIFNLKVNLAEHERNKDSERINRVNKYKYNVAKTVCSGQKIFGYDIVDKKLVVNQNEAKQLNDLYDVFIRTNSILEADRWFNENVCHRSYNMISKYLKDTKYIGKYKKVDGTEIDGFCPPIIDEEKFNKAQLIFKRNIKKYYKRQSGDNFPYIYNGILRCPECGYKLHGNRTKNNQYYRCRQAIYKRCSKITTYSELKIDKYMRKNILHHIEKLNINIESVREKEKQNKVNIKAIENKLDKLADLYLNDLINKEKYTLEFNNLNIELNKATMELEKQTNTCNTDMKQLKNFFKNNILDIYEKLTNEEKRTLWRSIIDNIVIKNLEEGEVEINFI